MSTLALVAVILNTLTVMVFPPIDPVHFSPALNFPPGSKFESAPSIPSFVALVTVTWFPASMVPELAPLWQLNVT